MVAPSPTQPPGNRRKAGFKPPAISASCGRQPLGRFLNVYRGKERHYVHVEHSDRQRLQEELGLLVGGGSGERAGRASSLVARQLADGLDGQDSAVLSHDANANTAGEILTRSQVATRSRTFFPAGGHAPIPIVEQGRTWPSAGRLSDLQPQVADIGSDAAVGCSPTDMEAAQRPWLRATRPARESRTSRARSSPSLAGCRIGRGRSAATRLAVELRQPSTGSVLFKTIDSRSSRRTSRHRPRD